VENLVKESSKDNLIEIICYDVGDKREYIKIKT